MKKLLFLFIFLLVICEESKACLNVYYSLDNHGNLHETGLMERVFNTNFNLQLLEGKLLKLEQEIKKKPNYKLLSDYAVLLLKSGKTKEAVTILEKLSDHYPNEYQIAANLGTAYELNGEVEKALQYIKRGIELNPKAHEGSEWVHIKVLETKLKLKKDPNYLFKNSVLRLTPKQKNDPKVLHQIFIQVKERFPFSPGPNEIMASILSDLGDCYANNSSIEFAKAIYTVSQKYYGSKDKQLDKKINEMIFLRGKYDTIKPVNSLTEGRNEKVTGVNYLTLLDNNNVANYQIQWSKILIDTDELLSLIHIKDSIKTEIEDEPVREKAEIKKSSTSKKEDSSNKFTFVFLGFIALLLVGVLIKKKYY